MRETGKSVQKAVRQRRLSAALRENLKRRKTQARARHVEAEPHDSAGIDADKAPALPSSRPTGERES
jgi:hypothetical protein